MYYYTNPTSAGNINGYTNGQSQTFTYNNVPCQDNTFQYQMNAHPGSNAFSMWSASGGTLSSTVDNGTILTVKTSGSSGVSITANFVMGLLVPLYVYPTTLDPNTGVSYWQDLINAKKSYPNVPFEAIVNPSSGPGDSANSDYTTWMTNLQNAGIKMLGYVYTHWGDRAIGSSTTYNSVEQAIANWSTYYPDFLNGIFFDQMNAPNSGHNNGGPVYYDTLTTYCHNNGLPTVFGNPGDPTNTSYIRTVDVITPYEGSGQPSESLMHSRTTGLGGISSEWGFFAYNVASVPSQSYLPSLSRDVGWIYETNYSNTYTQLPGYLTQEVDNLNTT